MLIDKSEAFRCTHPLQARRTWIDAEKLMTCQVCLTCGAEMEPNAVADLSGQQPLGTEFECIWDANLEKLYSQ